MSRLISLLTLGMFLSGCATISSPSPSAQATPDTAVARGAAAAAASEFVAAWQYRNWSTLLKLTDPGDVAHYTSASIIGLLTGFETMAGVTWLDASAGPAFPASPASSASPASPASRSPAGSSQSPTPVMLVEVRLSFYTANFGRVTFQRTLTLNKGAGSWRVRWRPSILFPPLGDGGPLPLQRTLGRRRPVLAEDGAA